jgi:group I intron endonuclease
MPQIYKITNLINKKIYIGKSLIPNEHYYGSGLQITAAIEKYGKDNFSKDIIEECSEDILDNREIYWIENLDARNPLIGYNISIGGTGGNHYWKTLDENGKIELRNKISTAKTGATIKYTDTHRENVKAGLKTFWENKKSDTTWLKSRANPKKYILSNGVEFIRIENLKEYCELNNLADTTLCSISTGNRYRPSKGWYCFIDNGVTNDGVLELIGLLKEKQKQARADFMEKVQNRPRYECTYCGISVTKSNLTKWHNNNCKNNGNH